jgi:hypothetical protein
MSGKKEGGGGGVFTDGRLNKADTRQPTAGIREIGEERGEREG